MVQPRAGQGAVQIALRLQPDLRDRIKLAAEQNGRSINSEIIAALEDAFPEGMTISELLNIYGDRISAAKTADERSALEDEINVIARKERVGFTVKLPGHSEDGDDYPVISIYPTSKFDK